MRNASSTVAILIVGMVYHSINILLTFSGDIESFSDLIWNRQVVVVADVICEIINAIVVVVFIDEVSVAYAKLVVVPGEVSMKFLSLVHVSYVFPTKSSIRQDCVATSIPVWISVQLVLYKWLGAVEA